MTELDAVLAHPLVRRLARSLEERPGATLESAGAATRRRAAVALMLRLAEADALELLMIKRASYAGDPWSGHIALPGGREEPHDASLVDTAIRETREETAIDIARRGAVLGALHELQPHTAVLPAIVITPVVTVVAPDVTIALSDEVADAFWVPLTALQDPAAQREIVLELTTGPRRVRSFGYGEHVIWGLTERILSEFLERIGTG